MATTKKWVLREILASKRLKVPVYFKRMAGIGPMSTSKLDDAMKFDSEQLAMMSPAYIHPLSCYEPEREPHQKRSSNERS